MTSVTISEKLRKRLKQLAAKYDTTQGKIIEMALDLIENKKRIDEINMGKENEIEKILKKVSQEVREKDPKLNTRRKLLEKKGISIDDIVGYTWGFNLEDLNR